ncbi:MAG: hypothetical protein F6K55_33410 [Moorea sp. SIO4A3]|nr:hypothetical protein [Moorena sp. SIO4A3]
MNEDELLNEVLCVYENQCRYLKEVELDGKQAWGRFSVPETHYAVKGRKYHLNAAEAIIVYEQIMYVAIGNIFIHGLLDLKQLPRDIFFPTVVDEKTLISRLQARFSKSVNSNDFSGVFSIKKILQRGKKYWFKTMFEINDNAQSLEVSLCVDLRGI